MRSERGGSIYENTDIFETYFMDAVHFPCRNNGLGTGTTQ